MTRGLVIALVIVLLYFAFEQYINPEAVVRREYHKIKGTYPTDAVLKLLVLDLQATNLQTLRDDISHS